MAKVLGVIGARLNSSRLPCKHLLDLAGKPIIARIFERLERIPEIDELVLATTGDAFNQPLVDWAQDNHKQVFAYSGDVNDLVGRVDALVQREHPEIVIYFCGDSPLIEPETLSNLIRGLLDQHDCDFVELAPFLAHAGKCMHGGFSIFRRAVWDRLVQAAKSPEEREHVGISLNHFAHTLSKCSVLDDEIFYGIEHRVSVDTPSDYQFMAEVYERWYAEYPSDSIVSLRWVIEWLKRDASLRAMNAHVQQKSVQDSSMGVLLVCHAGEGIGLGHLARTLAVARALQDRAFAGVRLLIHGSPVKKSELDLIPHRFVPLASDIAQEILLEANAKRTNVVLFDLHPKWTPQDFGQVLAALRNRDIRLVGIDNLFDWCNELDLLHVPAFYVAPSRLSLCTSPVYFGWDCYLLAQPVKTRPWVAGNNVLVLTGGSDATFLGRSLPSEMDAELPLGTEAHWVQGPYAESPVISGNPRLSWVVHHAPKNLDKLMAHANYAITTYGVSFFELLQYGLPVVVFSPYGEKDFMELNMLRKEDAAVVTADEKEAVHALAGLMTNTPHAESLARHAKQKINGRGALRLAERIMNMVTT